MKRVLFLCSGNYYRSRFAEIFFNWHAEQRGLRWKAESRGLTMRNIHPGFMSAFTLARLEELGIPVDSHQRMPIKATLRDFVIADHFVAMKRSEHHPPIQASFPSHVERAEFWEVHDLDCAGPAETLPILERKVLALIERLSSAENKF